tara:strand:+ start:288 stop:1157 length:870 start_codon:yes stop_codon:yes gene_type:complete
MAFKMKTSIGKIHANTHGTKPHTKSIAKATAPKPAKGNVSKPSPLNVGTIPQLVSKAVGKIGRNLVSKSKKDETSTVKKGSGGQGTKSSGGQGSGGGKTIKATTPPKTSSSGSGKKSYREAYKNANKDKYPTFESFRKAAIKYNRKKDAREFEKVSSDRTGKVKKIQKLTDNKINATSVTGEDINTKSDKTKKVLEERSEKPKVKKRGDKLRKKANKAVSVAEKNRLQNRADRKDGRAERRKARMERRSGNKTKTEAKEAIKKSRKKQASTARRSTASQSGEINNVKTD